MKYWDASAIIPLLANEEASDHAEKILAADQQITTWWFTRVECVSALARLERRGHISAPSIRAALRKLDALSSAWSEVQPDIRTRQQAERILRTHSLRAADALQLSAALTACDHHPSRLTFVCMDQRLREAAAREGFAVDVKLET